MHVLASRCRCSDPVPVPGREEFGSSVQGQRGCHLPHPCKQAWAGTKERSHLAADPGLHGAPCPCAPAATASPALPGNCTFKTGCGCRRLPPAEATAGGTDRSFSRPPPEKQGGPGSHGLKPVPLLGPGCSPPEHLPSGYPYPTPPRHLKPSPAKLWHRLVTDEGADELG